MKILGTGRALPDLRLTSEELDMQHGLRPGYLRQATGVSTRFVCRSETQIDLAVAAARGALEDAGLQASDLDLVISAAAVPYQPIPATAPAIQAALGLADGMAFATDVNATCLGFPVALNMVAGLMATGQCRTALVVSSEVASRGLPWATQPDVAGLFGDGAAAAVVTSVGDTGLRAAHFLTFPSAYDACSIGAGGTRFDFETEAAAFAAHSKFAMNGKELFKVTARHFAGFVETLLGRADTTRDGIDRVIAHQASPHALAHMIRVCGFTPDQVVDISADYGNQIAASIPFTLDHARRSGLVSPGDRIAMLGTSAGVSFGGLVLDL